MDDVVHAVRWVVEAALRGLDPFAPAVSLALIAVVTALGMLVVVRRTSPQRAIARTRARMAASIYEMRLYLDHPLQLLRAQGRLLGWTGAYLACLLPALLVLGPPLGLLYLHLETRHGLAPLDAPSTVVVRVELGDGVSTRGVAVEATGAVAVTAPLVRADDEGAVYARIAIRARGTHRVTARAAGAAVTKELVADPDASVVAPERRGGFGHTWSLGAEPPPDTAAIRAISVQHPEREDGLPVRWWLYWLGLATIVALALRGRFGVEL